MKRRPSADSLNAKRDRESARSREKSAASREIGPLPKCADPARRAACTPKLKPFLLTYFPEAFPLPFSPDHDRAITKLETVILHGGLYAWAMPRGSGKTTIIERAVVWALCNAHRRFTVAIGQTEGAAEQILASIKACLTSSDLLAADFPEICIPLRALENDARRCAGQICDGQKTGIVWTNKRLALPTIKGSKASGSIVAIAGLTGRIRGLKHTLRDGSVIRPDLVIPDDPQTRESAWSDGQCATRLRIISGDVLGLAGPGKKIAAAIPCTVIRRGDLSDQLLDRRKSPEWQGERSKLLLSPPKNEKLWEEYWQLRCDSLRADGDGSSATEFYRQHRKEMDEGAEAAWPQRHNADEISAIQNAMNLKFFDEEAFLAEYQNDPRDPAAAGPTQLRPDEICQRLNGHARGAVPTAAAKITAFVDVQKTLLYWMICAWAPEDFEGWVLDYGAFPEQPRRYFTLRQASPTLNDLFPGRTPEAAVRQGLETLCGQMRSREFRRDDGAAMKLDRILIDQGYFPQVVHGYIRAAGQGSIIMPAKGVGITASQKPMSEYRRQPGELHGTNWMVPKPMSAGEIRHVRHDANAWKTFVQTRLALPPGTRGAITLYGKKSGEHRMLADHLFSEFPTATEGHGRKLVEWRLRPGASGENHLLDDLVGCAVAASTVGCGAPPGPPRRPARKSARQPVYL